MVAEGVEEVVFGRDPPRTEAAVVEAGVSCSRGAADTPCISFSASAKGFVGLTL